MLYRTTLEDDAPIQSQYRVGGFLRLSGFNQKQLAGQHVGLAGIAYLNQLGTKLVPTYFGASLELGNAWQSRDDIRLDNTIVAGSLFVGADTLLGWCIWPTATPRAVIRRSISFWVRHGNFENRDWFGCRSLLIVSVS